MLPGRRRGETLDTLLQGSSETGVEASGEMLGQQGMGKSPAARRMADRLENPLRLRLAQDQCALVRIGREANRHLVREPRARNGEPLQGLSCRRGEAGEATLEGFDDAGGKAVPLRFSIKRPAARDGPELPLTEELTPRLTSDQWVAFGPSDEGLQQEGRHRSSCQILEDGPDFGLPEGGEVHNRTAGQRMQAGQEAPHVGVAQGLGRQGDDEREKMTHPRQHEAQPFQGSLVRLMNVVDEDPQGKTQGWMSLGRFLCCYSVKIYPFAKQVQGEFGREQCLAQKTRILGPVAGETEGAPDLPDHSLRQDLGRGAALGARVLP